MDANHFRQRAAQAREMAQFGDDMRLSRMLLELAVDLDAEAEAIEAGGASNRRGSPRAHSSKMPEGLLHIADPEPVTTPVRIIDLSLGGARFRTCRAQEPGSRAILELPEQELRLDGTILRMLGTEAAMSFDLASSADPNLSRLLRSEVSQA